MKKLITEEQGLAFEQVLMAIAGAMEGFKWTIRDVLSDPNLPGFKKQKSDAVGFEWEYINQTGNGDYGYHGEIIFPIGNKFIRVSYND